ncbi:MAG: type I glyceraldehyde-3-phosphate dehydrogenase [Chloroflexi bacterium]|nr:type I glyceraldehyde-3-phosphate dehydrogenase [Chloroflexota bacterium]MCH2535894.1 type I glyceraldehyde-3-phosphate dehydrogenase [Dehalococcoidia bacterium]MEE2928557.1 type I glyceraldehyde-3-phosphate dehydrogenase [Chloroflexota bacterium]HIB13733.1 type I glyceraldehyde-3-phosphate dehydrogenase [Dehalococcoidia bacterium]HIM48933.1 type I glyceraldehyde-3-phosphate dehydrogenase [Dehalococcoidia bacterium]
MTTRVGINGFGRIGRLVLRATNERYPDKLEVAAVNDLTDAKTNAHLLKYDTTYGGYPGHVEASNGDLVVDGRSIRVFSERDPAQIPWSEMGVDLVVESTGIFTDAEKAGGHLEGGAKKVVISAPARGEDLTIVLGVNEHLYDGANHKIVSNASCTTNCFATMVKVLHDSFGVEHGVMSTIHSYTNDQAILDQRHSDLRRARAAAANIIPTSTGAARAVGLVLPELNGKLDGIAFRVPTITGSITDFVATVSRDVTVDEINAAYQEAADGKMKGILEYSDEPLVSSDFKGNSHSCIIDGLSTMVMQGRMVKVMGWYDNEWGYSCRTADLCALIADKGI